MMSSKHLKTEVRMPMDRYQYVTTYSNNYKPYSERQLQINQLMPRSEDAPQFISPPQTEVWMPMDRYQYVTTYSNDYKPYSERQLQINQLMPRSEDAPEFISPPQSPSSSLGGVVDSTLTEARTQEVGATTEIEPLLCEDDGQLHYVFGRNGVTELSSHDGPAYCEDFHGPVYRSFWLQNSLHLPVALSPWAAVAQREDPGPDAESWDDSTFLGPAIGQNSTFLQPAATSQWSCSTLPLVHVPPAFYRTQQHSYHAEWAWPWMQQSDTHHHQHHHFPL